MYIRISRFLRGQRQAKQVVGQRRSATFPLSSLCSTVCPLELLQGAPCRPGVKSTPQWRGALWLRLVVWEKERRQSRSKTPTKLHFVFYLHVKFEISTAGENDFESGFALKTASFKDTPSCPLSHVAILPCPVTEAALFGQRIDGNAGTSCSHAVCSCRGITFQMCILMIGQKVYTLRYSSGSNSPLPKFIIVPCK